MDPSTMILMNQMLSQMQQTNEEEENREKASVLIACYGCEYMTASPVGCGHPNTIAVRWDKYNEKTYRMPSVTGCIKRGGACQFFEPDPEKGLGYKETPKAKRKARVSKIDNVLDKLDDDNCDINEFLKELKDLDDELNREDGVVDDEKDKDVGDTRD